MTILKATCACGSLFDAEDAEDKTRCDRCYVAHCLAREIIQAGIVPKFQPVRIYRRDVDSQPSHDFVTDRMAPVYMYDTDNTTPRPFVLLFGGMWLLTPPVRGRGPDAIVYGGPVTKANR